MGSYSLDNDGKGAFHIESGLRVRTLDLRGSYTGLGSFFLEVCRGCALSGQKKPLQFA